MKIKHWIVSGFWFLCLSCATEIKSPPIEIRKYSESSQSQIENGCKGFFDHYCSELYSPEASGNLLLDRIKPIQILQGETANQFSQVYYKYSLAKIRNRRLLPQDFQTILNRHDYFDRLEDYLRRSPIQKMSLSERLASDFLSYQLGAMWRSAIEQTVVSRMSSKYPGFHQIPFRLKPKEFEVEERKIRRKLISEFSRVLWHNDSNWLKVTVGFNELQSSFIRLFDKLALPKKLREDWKKKIQSLQLALPGSLPEISDEECSTTTANAYYYKYLNILTVCAGDFNSEDIILTLAHEMSHALDLDRTLYLYLHESDLGIDLTRLRANLCSKEHQISCKDWSQFKANLPERILDLEDFEVPLEPFNQCLKRNVETKPITEKDFDRLAGKVASTQMDSLATAGLFLKLIKKNLPMKNGKSQINPNYLDPCSYYLWSKGEEPIDDEIYALVYFAAEYQCGSNQDEGERLRSAIDVSQAITRTVTKAVMKAEGEFSDRPELVTEGLASSPIERFADVLGSYAVAEYLKRFETPWERRTKYLASSSWLCQEPSLESRYPEESRIVQEYNLESHVQGEERSMEVFSQPIREVLGCKKDFEFDECTLPFKVDPGGISGH